jgi:hypothetical protein
MPKNLGKRNSVSKRRETKKKERSEKKIVVFVCVV